MAGSHCQGSLSMRIALSSAAAPGASLPDLIDGCTRRGLFALHLVAGHGHGISTECSDLELQTAAAYFGRLMKPPYEAAV